MQSGDWIRNEDVRFKLNPCLTNDRIQEETIECNEYIELADLEISHN